MDRRNFTPLESPVRSPLALVAALLPAAVMACPVTARAITLPPDFVAEDAAPGAGFLGPTAIAFLPDGRLLVGEKNGEIWVVQDGAQRPEYFWNGTADVMIAGNAGLTGMAVDPHYAANHFVFGAARPVLSVSFGAESFGGRWPSRLAD